MYDFFLLYLPPVIGMMILGCFLHARLLEKPAYRGWWGEYKVNFMLRLCLSSEYEVFSNAIYRGRLKGESTQVDHIVVSRFGVFVLETKCFKGKVFADALDPSQWFQVVGRRKYKIQNPLMQNYAHVKAIQNVTGVHAQKIHSYAVMAGNAEFPEGMPERVYGIWPMIRKIQSYKAPVFSRGHTDDIARSLRRRRIKGGYWAAQKHVERLQTRENEKGA